MPRPAEALRRRRRRGRPRPRGAARRVLRPARAERRRQDHDDRDPRRAARRRRAARSRCSASAGGSGAIAQLRAAARHPAPGDAAPREAHRRGDAAPVPSFYPRGPQRRRGARASSSSREARRAGWASSRAARSSGWRCVRAGGRSRAAVPRRADHRARSAVAPPALGPARRASAPAAARSCSPRTTWTRRSGSATAWRSSITGKVIALGTPRELIASLGAEHVVEFALADGARRRRRRRSRALPGVREARVRGRRVGARHVARCTSRCRRCSTRCARAARALSHADDAQRHARGRVRRADREAPARCLSAAARTPPLVELTLARLREFLREPEAVFWVFVFPVLLALRAGHRVPRRRRPSRCRRRASTAPARAGDRGGARPARAGPRRCSTLAAGRSATRAARRPTCCSWSMPGTPPTYRFDPTRPESRLARLRRGRRAAARRRPRATRSRPATRRSRRAGLALHRLPGAGPARHEHHGHRHVGHRLLDRAPRGRASCSSGWSRRRCAAATTCSRSCSRGWCSSCSRSAALLGFGRLVFGVPMRGVVAGARASICLVGALVVRRPRPAGREPRADDRGRVGAA